MFLRTRLSLRPRPRRHPETKTTMKISNCREMCKFSYLTYGRHTRLRETHPDIAAEWDYDLNPRHLHPAIVINTTVQPLWWKCAKCEHSFCLSLDRRTILGKGCPKCLLLSPKSPVDEHAMEGEADALFAPLPVNEFGQMRSHPEPDRLLTPKHLGNS